MTILDRIPLDRITAEARQIHFWRTAVRVALTVLGALLFGLGWLAAKTIAGGWFALMWTVAAVKVGWQQARTQPPATQ